MNYIAVEDTGQTAAQRQSLHFRLSNRKLARPLAFLFFIGLGCGSASAQLCFGSISNSNDTNYYQGYSDNSTDAAGNGTSTVDVNILVLTNRCQGESASSITITTYNYVDGPGNSDYDAHDYVTCEVVGDYFSCDDF